MTTRHWVALVFAASAAPRVAVLLRTTEPPPNYYWEIATSLLASGSYGFGAGVTTAIEPLYPFCLAAARLLTGDRFALVMLLQVLAASAGGVLLFLLTLRLTGRLGAALAAAGLYALYPYYVRQSVAPHELTLSVVLLIGSAWQYSRTVAPQPEAGAFSSPRPPALADSSPAHSENIRHAALLGVWLGLLVLLRFTFAPVCFGAIALLLVGRRLRAALVATAIVLVMLAPWVLRTRAIDGSFLPTRAGENLFISSCEFAEEVVPFYDVDLMVGYAFRSVDADRLADTLPPELVERAINERLVQRAFACIRADPARAARLKLRNVVYVFAPLLLPAHARVEEAAAIVEDGRLSFVNIYPRPRFDTVLHAIAHTTILIGAVIGLGVRRRRLRQDAYLLVIVASIAAVYAVFFPTTRLTSPMMVVLMAYAGVGFNGVATGSKWLTP